MEEAEDIGDVVESDEGEEAVGGRVVKGEVLSVDEYTSCISCKGKVQGISEVVGECGRCGAKVRMEKCSKSVSVRFVVEGLQGNKWHLTAFGQEVQAITSGQCRETIIEKMPSAPNMSFTLSVKDAVRHVQVCSEQ